MMSLSEVEVGSPVEVTIIVDVAVFAVEESISTTVDDVVDVVASTVVDLNTPVVVVLVLVMEDVTVLVVVIGWDDVIVVVLGVHSSQVTGQRIFTRSPNPGRRQ